MPKLTANQQRIREQYTSTETIFGKRCVLLEVENQTFHARDGATKQGAEWTRDMLAIAIETLINKESK